MSIAATVAGVLQANGVSHMTDLAMNTMRIESAGNANARNSRSSATGLFQFVEGTWNEVMPGVPFSRATDPRQNTIAFIRLTERNERYLEGRLGRDPQDWEVYLAHFAGSGRAAELLSADADARLSSIFSADAMQANPHLGELETVGNYLAWVQAKYNGETYREGQYRTARSGVDDDEDRFGDNERGRRMTQESLRHDNQVNEDAINDVMTAMLSGLATILTAIFSAFGGGEEADRGDLGDMSTQNPALVAERTNNPQRNA